MQKVQEGTEDQLQAGFVKYVRLQYPKLQFKCDYLSGVKLPKWIAARAKRLGNTKSWPDFFAALPAGRYHGIFLELKKEGEKLFKKNGEYKTEHLALQAAKLESLRANGYYAEFAIGFDSAKDQLDKYISLQDRL